MGRWLKVSFTHRAMLPWVTANAYPRMKYKLLSSFKFPQCIAFNHQHSFTFCSGVAATTRYWVKPKCFTSWLEGGGWNATQNMWSYNTFLTSILLHPIARYISIYISAVKSKSLLYAHDLTVMSGHDREKQAMKSQPVHWTFDLLKT